MKILFWGRFGNYGPDYPRNRVIIEALEQQGHEVQRFLPKLSALADWEAHLRGLPVPDVLWVPCFRQRDLSTASRFAQHHQRPLVFDPLISAYDKQVFEREKFRPDSRAAQRLLAWERRLFALPDAVVADTAGHAEFFHETLGVPLEKLFVIPVGAEEKLFKASPLPLHNQDEPPELVFFGTFIGLQGVQYLVEAIELYDGPPLRWRLLGDGPLRAECEMRVTALRQNKADLDVQFEDWRPLAELPGRLQQADAFFGIFGNSAKAQRVIPNKVYQGLALGRPVITAATNAFTADLRADENQGLFWCRPGDPADLVQAIKRLLAQRAQWPQLGAAARHSYEQRFSSAHIQHCVAALLQKLPRS